MDTPTLAEQEYHRSKLLAWNPRQIDLQRDAADWAALAPPEHDALVRFVGLFDAVQSTALRHLPALALALARRGHPVSDLQCLAAQVWETARHVEWHGRWLADVGRAGGPLAVAGDDHYQALVAQDLPTYLDLVLTDHGSVAVTRAAVTYHLVCAGVVLEPAMGELARALRAHDILPGLTYGLDLVRRDLARHADVGSDLVARVVAEAAADGGPRPPHAGGDGPEAAPPIDLRGMLAPPLRLAAGTLAAVFRPWGTTAPLGIDLDRMADAARAAVGTRLARIEAAAPAADDAAG